MEMFAVFALGHFAARLQQKPTAMRLAVVAATLVFYFALKLHDIASLHEKSLYSLAGVDRSMRSEELRRVYRTLAREKHPDRNPGEQSEAEFVVFQKAFETLEDLGYRHRYEVYGGVGEDASLNSLLAAVPFYVCGAVMAYCLTCERESLYAGRAALLIVICLGVWEWKTKKGAPDVVVGHPWMPLSIYEQFEALRSLFYPFVLTVYCISAFLQERSASRKASHRMKVLEDLKANTAAFRRLQHQEQISARDLDQAVLQNSHIGQWAAEQLSGVGQKKSKWSSFVSIGIFIGLFYFSSSSTPAPEES